MIRGSEDFHALVKAHRYDEETVEEALQRLVGCPSPEVLADIIAGGDEEATAEMRRVVEKQERDRRAALRERFE